MVCLVLRWGLISVRKDREAPSSAAEAGMRTPRSESGTEQEGSGVAQCVLAARANAKRQPEINQDIPLLTISGLAGEFGRKTAFPARRCLDTMPFPQHAMSLLLPTRPLCHSFRDDLCPAGRP